MLKGLGLLKNVLIGLVWWLVIKPLLWLFRTIGQPLTLWLYHRYLPIRQSVHSHAARLRQSWLYPLTTRYTIHGVIIILTIVVTTNSLSAREIRTEDFGSDSILAALVGRESEEIVETAATIKRQAHYADQRGVLHYSPAPVANEANGSSLATVVGGTSLVKTATPTTTVVRASVSDYVVQGGDTISTIASRFGISTNTILWANNLNETDFIKPGQVLKVPPASGVVHTVKSGDTIGAIATKYEADESKILEFNKLADAAAIEVGQTLIVPGGRIAPPPAPTRVATSTGGSIFSSSPPPSVRVAAGGRLLWPTVSHRIYTYFTWRHTGIDIDTGLGTPIYAAEAGRVVQAQGGWNGGYGIMVILDHGNGMQTLYAHASRLYVTVGQYIEKGQTIAGAGSTGRSSGTHLHFEVRFGGSRVNPLGYL